MSQLISLSVTSRDGVATTGTYGFDVEDIVSPIRELPGGAGCYFTARMKKGTTSGHGETLGAIEYRVSETLAQIVALSSNLLLLSVTERRGESLAEDMIFIASRISENIKPVTGGSQFYYHEDGDPLPVDYIVSQSVANIITQASFSSCYAMTYAQLTAAMAANELICGTQIRITDRGDQGIIVRAISSNQIDPTGVRLMNVPKNYEQGSTVAGLNNLGIYYSAMTPVQDDLTIWGGLYWRNQNGNIGTPTSDIALDAEWLVINKPGYGLSNEFYDVKIFNVIYDVVNDWIAKQWDDKGNVFGMSFDEYSTVWGIGYNPVDHSDWNMLTSGPSYWFFNNKCLGVLNNSRTEKIVNNICDGLIIGNDLFASGLNGEIENNNCQYIYYNRCSNISFNHLEYASISNNNNTGVISYNHVDAINSPTSQNIQNMPSSVHHVSQNVVQTLSQPGYAVDITGLTNFTEPSNIMTWAHVIILTSSNATETIQDFTGLENSIRGKKYRFMPEPGLTVTFQHGVAPNQPQCEGAVNAVLNGNNGDWVEFEVTSTGIKQSNIGTY